MQTLTVRLENGVWVADFSKTFECDKITRLFGTPVIPTPYTQDANWQTVQANVQKLNPQYNVAVDLVRFGGR